MIKTVPAPPSLRWLIVDDDRVVGTTVGELLESLGIDVTVTTSGAEALTALSMGEFDALLTDWRMPGLSGEELIGEARSRLERAGTEVLIMSGGYDTTGTAVRHAINGFPVRLLAKPIRISDLKAIVTSMRGPQQQQQPQQPR